MPIAGSLAHLPDPDITKLDEALADTETIGAIVEALTDWLEEVIPAALVVYWNPRQRLHYMACTGTCENSTLMHTAWDIIDGPLPRIRFWQQREWFFHLWMGSPLQTWDRFLIVESGNGPRLEDANHLMRVGLNTLQPHMRRVLEECSLYNR
ncbi:MAG: hypothetical protein HQL50_03045 [Magnetococcales bacterium]|nr:hypothetical protein [Magnetococcales bacterium]